MTGTEEVTAVTSKRAEQPQKVAAQEVASLRRQNAELLASLEAAEKQRQALQEQLAAHKQQLQAQTGQIQALAHALQAAEDTMHRRTSQLLHDDIQQVLYGIRLRLLKLAQSLSRSLPDTAKPKTQEELRWLLKSLDNMVATVRNLSFVLSPPVRPDAMVLELLQSLASRLEEMYDLKVDVRISETFQAPEGNMPNGTGNLLFRLMRELLLNLVKHTGTRQVQVTLGQERDEIILEIRDESEAIHLSSLLHERAAAVNFGSIQKRVEAAGGQMKIAADITSGTLISILLPLDGLAIPESEPALTGSL